MAAGLAATVLVAAVLLGTRAAAQEVAEEPTVFPAGEHRDEVFYFCTACHSSRLVRNQAMTRGAVGRDVNLDDRTPQYASAGGADRERFLDYLTQAFGPSAATAAPRRSDGAAA